MSDRELAVREAAQIVQPKGFDDATKELIRKTVSDARNPLTQDELDLFLAVCQYTGLNPLNREIYPLKIDGRLTVWTGIDGHRRIAQASRRFRGMAGPFWCGDDGLWCDVWLKATPPAACKVGVYLPGAAEPTWGIAYYKNYKARTSATWKSQPEQMLAVRAESFALRKCFSRELAGLSLEEEEPERPAYVDADGVIDEGHADRALESGERSPRMQAVAEEMEAAVAEGEALEPDELDADWGPVSVTEATRLACAAFVDEVKAANPKIRVVLPPEQEGEAAWQAWLTESRAKWQASSHNPARDTASS